LTPRTSPINFNAAHLKGQNLVQTWQPAASGYSFRGETRAAQRNAHGTAYGVTLMPVHTGVNTTETGQSGQNLALDLTSTSADIVLGSRLFGSNSSVTITVGGFNETFKAGSQVTAGQYVAIQQVLGGGAQGVLLSAAGAATGGTFSLNAVDKSNVTALLIPASVTALDYISKNANISVNGNLTNYGSLDVVSTSSRGTSGVISAADITNEAGARLWRPPIISSTLEVSLAPAL
jgi:hypothetical protein